MKKAIHHAYPTLIGQFRVEDAEELNRDLTQLILERERRVGSQDHSNVGGWHSPQDLLTWPSPAIERLRGLIGEAVQDMVAATLEMMRSQGIARSAPKRLQFIAWANVSRRGNYHRVHNHPAAIWSGVYYVQSGESTDTTQGGLLELLDPRPFTEMVPAPGDPCGQRITLRAEPGAMVLFPSWLYHSVTPYFGCRERISISFNASVEA